MSVHRIYASAVAALVLGSIAANASAEEPATPQAAAPRFGGRGDFALAISHDLNTKLVDIIAGATEVSASYFIIPNLSLGLGIGGQYVDTPSSGTTSSGTTITNSGTTYTALELSPRVGYTLSFGQYVSLWPQVGLQFETSSTSSKSSSGAQGGSGASGSSSTNSLAFTVTAPLLIHPVRGFFIGAGPTVSTDIVNSTSSSYGGVSNPSADNPKVTTLGLTALVGGVF